MALEKKQHNIKSLTKLIADMQAQIDGFKVVIDELHREIFPPNVQSIHKVETCNNEVPAEPREERGMKMNEEDRLASMRNACAILPPNLKVNGRHHIKNVQAICGFPVTRQMMDKIYKE